ncbi:MAG: deoxyguanosinetriphosphate triphosphohydrolase [Candidatus Omnitrophota bacterium]
MLKNHKKAIAKVAKSARIPTALAYGLNRVDIVQLEDKTLSPLAMKSKYSLGRKHAQEEHPYRSAYQRDRDRIIHSAAFRRLEYKTQVFVYHEGDYFRTRLTHSLEVAQIARTISKILRLNEDLTEAIALAHDLGHTPFGHAVEMVLDELMRQDGGFNHNIQGLRVVDILEQRYPHFKGLNLSWETREGIAKHSTNDALTHLPELEEFNPYEQPSMEAQVMDVADEIAYNNHDLDDGIKSGLLSENDFKKKVELWEITHKKVQKEYSRLNREVYINLMIRNLINLETTDLITATLENIKKSGVANYKDVKRYKKRIVGFSPRMFQMQAQLRKFLFEHLYCHWRVLRMTDKAKRFIRALFDTYLDNSDLLPPDFKSEYTAKETKKRMICDYIAGMTDRYAIEEYKRLFEPYEKV